MGAVPSSKLKKEIIMQTFSTESTPFQPYLFTLNDGSLALKVEPIAWGGAGRAEGKL